MSDRPRPSRRFIAGAVCPECRAIDRIVLEESDGERRRRCVSCGYSDTLVRDTGVEAPTRFTRHGGSAGGRQGPPDGGEAPAPVRIVDPGKPGR